VLAHGYRSIQQDYALGDVLGQGAFGVVRLAVHKRTGLRYAVKTVGKAQLRRRVDVEDLRREVSILAQLSSHPNVAALLHTYEDEQAVHIVLELCEGGELFDRIAADAQLTERTAVHWFRMMVEVVRHAHALGICHRDIKPENFMLSDKTDKARVKACDFGLSQFFRPGRNFHSLVGSAFYVAPGGCRRPPSLGSALLPASRTPVLPASCRSLRPWIANASSEMQPEAS
jgi:calcium-dependent protein kinase